MDLSKVYSCDHWRKKFHEEGYVPFCVADKVLYSESFLAFCFLAYEIWVHKRLMNMDTGKLRVKLIILAALSSLYGSIYFATFSMGMMFKGYEVLEILKFSQLYLICYYFTYKASKLLPNRHSVLRNLQYFFMISFVLLFALSIYVGIVITRYLASSDNLL